MVTGTTPTAGSTTVIPDNNRQEPQGEWERIDSFIRFTSGLGVPTGNLGVERRITGFSAGVSLTVAPALGASVGSGSTYYISKTFNDSDVALAVNSSLRDQFPERMIESIASSADVGTGYTISVPSAASNAIAELIRVDRSVGSTNWDYTELVQGVDYRIDPSVGSGATQTFVSTRTAASGGALRFIYRRPAAEMSADTDATDEPVSLVLAGARKWLAIAEGDPAAIERHGREFESAKKDYVKSRSAKRINTPVVQVFGGFGRTF